MKDYFFNHEWESQVKMLLGSRGIGKTDYITMLGVAYEVYCDNKKTFLIVCAENKGCGDIMRVISEALKTNEVKLSVDSIQSISVEGHIGKDNNISALSLGSRSFRRRHPDYVLFDDPVTPNHCSAADRRQLRVIYEETLKLAPKIGIIGQPVHKLDLYAELHGLVDTLECKYGTVPELDPDLDAQRSAGVSEASIQASYFLNIIDNLMMPFNSIEEVDYFPDGDTIAFIDPAIKDSGKDTTAIAVGKVHFDGNFVGAGIAMRKPWEECLDEMREIFTMFHVKLVYFEDNVCGSEPPKRLTQITGIPIKGYTAIGNKHGRIMRMAIHKDSIRLYKIKSGSNNVIEYNRFFNKNIKEYEAGAEIDDPPDSLSSLMEKSGLLQPMKKRKK
jgi:hypothetical protein